MNVDHEPKPTERGVPPAYLPSSGTIRVENLSAQYSDGVCYRIYPELYLRSHFADSPEILHGISFEIKSGERVGVGKFLHFKIGSELLIELVQWVGPVPVII